MKTIKVLEPGFISTIQDAGRIGYQKLGIPKSGAMDIWNMYLSNILVGKDKNASVLEITYTGPRLEFLNSMTISITGADMQASLNGYLINMYQGISVKSGDVLSFKGLKEGLRSYISFSGNIITDEYFGSSSTYEKYKLGRKLEAGDTLITDDLHNEIHVKVEPVINYDNVVRIVKTFEYSDELIDEFLDIKYKISNHSDRMGIKLDGDSLKSIKSSDIISSPIVPGTIQIPKNGIPIIMMKDAQTIGGYMRLGCVITSDLAKLAQLKPGDELIFKVVSLDEAKAIRLASDKKINKFENASKIVNNKITYRVVVNNNLYDVKVEER